MENFDFAAIMKNACEKVEQETGRCTNNSVVYSKLET